MVEVYKEMVESKFAGTIIDIETIGEFCNQFSDSRTYAKLVPVIFGSIDQNGIRIHYAKNHAEITELKEKIPKIIPGLKHPFHAFNSIFETAVLFHNIGQKVLFEKELNLGQYEAKWSAVQSLGIPQYGDPFNDTGKLCMDAWQKGDTTKAVAHNRSCLLKERDILLKRGFRKPDELQFVKKSE